MCNLAAALGWLLCMQAGCLVASAAGLPITSSNPCRLLLPCMPPTSSNLHPCLAIFCRRAVGRRAQPVRGHLGQPGGRGARLSHLHGGVRAHQAGAGLLLCM